MRLWRWLTAWTPQSRAENRRVKTDLLRVLLPGVASSQIDEALECALPELQRDEALREIFEQEIELISQFETYTQLQSKLSELHGVARQVAIWQELESHSQWSALRERVTERLMESHWAQEAIKYLESYGIDRSISTITFYCLPSVEEVNRSHEFHQVNLLDARHEILSALLARNPDQLLERSANLLSKTRSAQPPLFAEVINAIARFISESILHAETQTEHHDQVPAHVSQLVYTMRRLVATYPHQVFTLHITQVIDAWIDRVYGSTPPEEAHNALAEPQEIKEPEENLATGGVSSERDESRPQKQEVLDHITLDPQAESALTPETTGGVIDSPEESGATPADESSSDAASEAELHKIRHSDEEESDFELLAKSEPEPEPQFAVPAFDHAAALSRVDSNFEGSQALTDAISAWEPHTHPQSDIEKPSWALADEYPDVLLLVKGEVRSLWSKWVRTCHFSAASPYPSLITVNPSLDQLDSWVLKSGGVPLMRNEVIKLLSAVGLRLPEVWELQALHASEDLGADVAYWTRNSREHLWSPRHGRWISPRKKLSVALTGFWDELIAQQITLTPEQEEVALDADLLLGELASERMEDFDFGVDTTVAVLDEEPFVSEPDHLFSFESPTDSSVSPNERSPLAEPSVTLIDEPTEILTNEHLSSKTGADEILDLEAKPTLMMAQPFADDENISFIDQEPDEESGEEETQTELESPHVGKAVVDRVTDRKALDTLAMTPVDLPEPSEPESTHDENPHSMMVTEMSGAHIDPRTTRSDLVPVSLEEQAPMGERSTSLIELNASISKSTLGMTSLESEVTEVSSDDVKEISSVAPTIIPSGVSDLNDPLINKTTLGMTSLASEVTGDDQRSKGEVQQSPAEESTQTTSTHLGLGIDQSADHLASRDVDLPTPELASDVATPEAILSSHFPGLSATYLSVISEQTEEFRELLRLLAEQKRGLKNDLAQQAGISRTRVMIEIQKFNRQLEAAQLPKLILSKFETTRTAPVSGSYLHWLG